MPLIQCDGCGAVFKAGLEAIGKTVGCPRCKTRFVAVVKRAGPKQKSSNARTWTYVGVGAGLVIVVILGITLNKKKTPPPSSTDGTVAAASRSSSFASEPESPSEPAAPPPTKDELEGAVHKFLTAIQQADTFALGQVVSFVQYHDGMVESSGGTAWSDLDEVGKDQAKGAIADQLFGDEAHRDFLRRAKVESIVPVSKEGDRAQLTVFLKSMVDADQQERTLSLRRFGSGSTWMVVAQEAGPIGDPAKLAAQEHEATKARVAAERREAMYGKIEEVEFLPETSATDRARYQQLALVLFDETAGRRQLTEAKNELTAAGKPAIPALLNVVVPHHQMNTPPEGIGVNLAVGILRDITGKNFGFAPMAAGTDAGSESREAAINSLRRWYGWWRDKKDTWTGPDPVPEEGDGL